MSRKNVNRRTFLKGAAAGAAVLSLSAASYARVYKANERIGVGFVGVGGRCQAHLDIIAKMQKESKARRRRRRLRRVGRPRGRLRGRRQGRQEDDATLRPGALSRPPRRSASTPTTRSTSSRTTASCSTSTRSTSSSSPRPTTGTPRSPSTPPNAKQARLLRKADDQDHRRGPRRRRCHGARHNVVMTVGVQSMADPTWLQGQRA